MYRGKKLHGVFIPTFSSDGAFWTTVVAILGTTINPICFWQASQKVEGDQKSLSVNPLLGTSRLEVYSSVADGSIHTSEWRFPNLVALAIIITTAATLHAAGTTNINPKPGRGSAEPIAGPFAFAILPSGSLEPAYSPCPPSQFSCLPLGEPRQWPIGLAPAIEPKLFTATIAISR